MHRQGTVKTANIRMNREFNLLLMTQHTVCIKSLENQSLQIGQDFTPSLRNSYLRLV
jgi:hypothetical protein